MAWEEKPYPDFSWSYSRWKTLCQCAREYYWRYYGSHGGWSPSAPPLARKAYMLKQITSFPMVLGSAVHAAAAEIAHSIRRELPRPSRPQLERRVRHALRELYRRSQDLDAFRARPKDHPVAHEIYYGEGLSEEYRQHLEEKLTACLDHLMIAPVWNDVVEAGPDSIRVVEELVCFEWDSTDLWVAPDLVYRSAGDQWVLVDWKTGRLSPDPEQLGVYGLYAREALELEPPFLGRLVGLLEAQELVEEITAEALKTAEDRWYDSVLAMQALLSDKRSNQPLPMEHFPLTDDRRRCSRCNFYSLCEVELERSD